MKFRAALLMILSALWCFPEVQAQVGCPSSDLIFELSEEPAMERVKMDHLNQMWIWRQEKPLHAAALGAPPPVYTVPVVFHVITRSGAGINDARILQSLDWLNASFRNEDYYDPSTGADVEIEFCLARRDPSGNASSGINRITDPLGEIVMENEDAALKNIIRWDTREYLNVWIVDEINSAALGSGVAGYATFPTSHGSSTDGIVVEARFTGVGEPENAVLTHEAGHYFGLYHTFEGGCQNDDCMRDGDRICDTPPDQSTGYAPCAQGMNTCQTDVNSGFATDQPDMISNYMDYSRLECYNQFTPQQKDRMRMFLEGIRASLLESLGCQDPCSTPVMANIIPPMGRNVVCDSILFRAQNTTSNYEWFINGVSYKNGNPINAWFDQPGNYQIILKVSSADGNCVDRDTVNITVGCNFDLELLSTIDPCYASFSSLDLEVDDVGGATVEWWVNGGRVGSGTSLMTSFPDGAYRVVVKAFDTKCRDSISFNILVGCREICGNGFDDDNDGLYDCFDPDCCDECMDHYFKACSEDYEDCLDERPVSVKLKWETAGAQYNPVFTGLSGDVDGDGQIEIVSWSFADGLVLLTPDGDIKTILGQPGGAIVQWTVPMAMADIDRDGSAELFYVTLNNELIAVEHDGTVRWLTGPVATRSGFFQWDPVHVIDANLDGNPVVVAAYNFYDASTGAYLGQPGSAVDYTFPGGHYVFADVLDDDACPDCEGLELINAHQVVSISDDYSRFNVITSHNQGNGGQAAVADWDMDGDLDVVGVFRRRIVIWDGQTNQIIASTVNPNNLGTPLVANFDDDPEPEFAMIVFLNWRIVAYDNDVRIMWQDSVSEPSAANPVCFDIDHDGSSEIVIRDNSNLTVLNGEDGAPYFAVSCESVTNDERPLIADIDGDNHAEIVVICAEDGSSLFGRVRAYEGDQIEWPNTRPVMFNYANFQMGINDDLTIPTFAQRHHLPAPAFQDINSSMTQLAIPSEPDSVEYTLTIDSIWCEGDSTILARFTWCNYGKGEKPNTWLSLYDGPVNDPNTKRIYSREWVGLRSGECVESVGDFTSFFDITTQMVCLVVNDDGTRTIPFDYDDGMGFGSHWECDYGNNIACADLPDRSVQQPNVPDQYLCGPDSTEVVVLGAYSSYLWSTGDTTNSTWIQNPGQYWVDVRGGCGGMASDTFNVSVRSRPLLMLPDTIRNCESQVTQLRVPSGFKSYSWQDGRPDSFYTAFTEGIYWVEVIDSCDQVLRDSTVIILEKLGNLKLPDTVEVCRGDTVDLEVNGYTEVSWEPNQNIDCFDCPRVRVYPDTSGWYYAFVQGAEGCFTSDSTYISLKMDIAARDTLFACAGDSIDYRNNKYAVGEYEINISNPMGCDTVLTLTVGDLESDTLVEIIPVCFGDSLFFRDSFYFPGEHVVFVDGGANCDTLYRLMVTERPDIDAMVTTTPSCSGDSTGTAMVTPMVTGTRLVLNWSDGDEINDSTATGFGPGTYAVIVIDELNCSKRFTFSIDSIIPADYDICVEADSCSAGGGLRLFLDGQVVGVLAGVDYREEGKSFEDLSEGEYTLSVIDSSGCFTRDTVLNLDNPLSYNYDIVDRIQINIGETTNVPITGDIPQLVSAAWENQSGLICPDCFYLEANPLVTTTYTVILMDENGCEHVLMITVEVDGFVNVYVPNIFSPNGDNINDRFRPFPSVDGLILDQFEIYSRWGELIYREVDVTMENAIGWDGTFNDQVLSNDVFVYTVVYRIGDQTERLSGSVTLMR